MTKMVKVGSWSSWKPQRVGAVLEGSYTGAKQVGGPYPHVTHGVRCDDGSRWYVSQAVARKLFEESGVKPGERVRLVLTEWREGVAHGGRYARFDLYVEARQVVALPPPADEAGDDRTLSWCVRCDAEHVGGESHGVYPSPPPGSEDPF
jgi:hypothetical protein